MPTCEQEFSFQEECCAQLNARAVQLLILHRDLEPIVSAIRRGDDKTVFELAASMSNRLTTGNSEGWTPLHEAACYGQAGCVKALLKAKPTLVDKRTLHEQTALLLAVDGKHLACVRTLLENGADPDISNKNKVTPLYKACEWGSLELVQLILAFGGSVNQRCKRGWTALHETVSQDNTELSEALLQAGAIIDPANSHGITPLIVAAQQGRAKAVDLLITKGADVNLQSCDGASALSEASKHGHKDIVELLLQHNADANKATKAGLLPLHIAAQYGQKEIIPLLLSVTSRAQIRHSSVTPLHLAAENNQLDVVQFLIKSGADVNARLSPERSARFHDHRVTAVYSAVANGHEEVAAILLKAGANPNIDPISLLLVAVQKGLLRTVSSLVECGANVNVNIPAQPTAFPGVLLYSQNLGVLQYLLDNGFDAQTCFMCDCDRGLNHSLCATQNTGHTSLRNQTLSGSNITPNLTCTESVTNKLQFCDWISSPSVSPGAGPLINLLLDYVGNIKLCSKITQTLGSQQEWGAIQEKAKSPRPLMHLCRLRVRQLVGLRRLVSLHTLPLPDRVIQYLSYNGFSTKDSLIQMQGTAQAQTDLVVLCGQS
ncbi:ankyrin repeat and SOCS box protein 2-like [Chanos chanos]|uniref:Ankyrin repeat and SOCS box protein 2-like n=1 Tax=Chanos chanos TaxID=29144 RepID=A0A6J2WNM1_CHACN|nr:ankyrin repeat and SOCS box protein 2-like [Chanos chanos]